MTPSEWYANTIGKKYDVDGAYGAQCWDYFAYFCNYNKLNVNTYCSTTGYAGDLWNLKFTKGYGRYFEFIYDPSKLRNGDWCFWRKHVAMYYNGREIGQNQNGHMYVTSKEFNYNGFLGAMRWKGWDYQKGVAECYSGVYKHTYKTTVALNLRTGGSTDYPVLVTMPTGCKFNCYGYYHIQGTKVWLYGTCSVEGKTYTGFCSKEYLVN